MESESLLPAGWADVLDEIHLRLDRIITEADARILDMPAFDAQPMVAERRAEIAQWNDRLERLSEFMASSEAGVQAIDDTLAVEETHARDRVETCGRLQQRLAECTRRAIG